MGIDQKAGVCLRRLLNHNCVDAENYPAGKKTHNCRTGFTILMAGIAMIALPGPAVIVIPIGLGILATEFVWARRLLKALKNKFKNQKEEA